MENNLQNKHSDLFNSISETTNSQSTTITPPASVISKSSITTHAGKQLKTSLICTFLLLIGTLTVFIAQTYAYFTYSTSSESNRIVTGSHGISIIEVNDSGHFSWSTDPINIMPASFFDYGDVGVKNSGTLPVYIRIKVEKSIIQSEHEISPGWEDLIVCNFNADGGDQDLWIYHEGYYYYKFALESGEETTPIFDTVFFSPQMGNEFKNSIIKFDLICQSVQVTGNSDNPITAWGWPDASNQTN